MSVKWGVIGAGGIAARRTIPEGLAASDRCALAAVMDSDAGRAQAVAGKFGVPHWYTDVDRLLAHPGLQAVYIATPNHLHKEQAVAAARAGKHVLVEKPMALTLADAEAMIEACRQNGVRLMVGYMMRFHAHHRRLKQMIDAGDLGQVVFGRAQLTCWYPPIPGAWRQDPALGGGGAYMDMGTHCLDLLEMLVGPARSVAAHARALTHSYPVDDSSTVLVEFESGAQGVVDANYNIADEVSQNVLEIRGTRGAVYADHTIGQDSGGNMTAYLSGDANGYDAAQARSGGGAQKIVVEPINIYRAEVEHLSDCIEQESTLCINDAIPINDGESGLHSLRLALLVYESARTGKVMRLDA